VTSPVSVRAEPDDRRFVSRWLTDDGFDRQTVVSCRDGSPMTGSTDRPSFRVQRQPRSPRDGAFRFSIPRSHDSDAERTTHAPSGFPLSERSAPHESAPPADDRPSGRPLPGPPPSVTPDFLFRVLPSDSPSRQSPLPDGEGSRRPPWTQALNEGTGPAPTGGAVAGRRLEPGSAERTRA
jgi:hypothetical protein